MDAFVQSVTVSGPKARLSTGGVLIGWWVNGGKEQLFVKQSRWSPSAPASAPSLSCSRGDGRCASIPDANQSIRQSRRITASSAWLIAFLKRAPARPLTRRSHSAHVV